MESSTLGMIVLTLIAVFGTVPSATLGESSAPYSTAADAMTGGDWAGDEQARGALGGPCRGSGHGFALGAAPASEQVMSARTAQFLIAAVFLILGGWALFAPASVIELAFTQPYRDTSFINRFTIACFGSQAVLFGLMALVTRWSARSFAVFAVLLLFFSGGGMIVVRTIPSISARFSILETVACDMCMISAISACRLPSA